MEVEEARDVNLAKSVELEAFLARSSRSLLTLDRRETIDELNSGSVEELLD